MTAQAARVAKEVGQVVKLSVGVRQTLQKLVELQPTLFAYEIPG
jgi:hypothetical protein